jgi:hypothetical protein
MNLFESGEPDTQLPLAQQMIKMADDLAEFNCVNAFLCSALSAVMSSHEPLGEEVIQGAKHCSAFILARAQELKHSMDQVRDQYLAEHH